MIKCFVVTERSVLPTKWHEASKSNCDPALTGGMKPEIQRTVLVSTSHYILLRLSFHWGKPRSPLANADVCQKNSSSRIAEKSRDACATYNLAVQDYDFLESEKIGSVSLRSRSASKNEVSAFLRKDKKFRDGWLESWLKAAMSPPQLVEGKYALPNEYAKLKPFDCGIWRLVVLVRPGPQPAPTGRAMKKPVPA